MARAEVVVNTRAGRRTVEGDVFGPWAVTPATSDDRRRTGLRWTVTHAPTGHAALRYRRKADACRAARALRDDFGDGPWAGTDVGPHWLTRHPVDLRRLRARCAELILELSGGEFAA